MVEERNQTGSCLHVFDMDGTLLRSTATIELARTMGQLHAGEHIERLWFDGAISDDDFWSRLLKICENATTADLQEAFDNAPWMDGIAQTFADINARGEEVIVISQSPAFFVRGLELWGASESYGSKVEVGEPLETAATLLPMAKVRITGLSLAARNLSPKMCVVYGDSSSDLELFRTYSNSVAVNASPALESLSAMKYVGTDIREAYALGRQLLARTARKQFTQGGTH